MHAPPPEGVWHVPLRPRRGAWQWLLPFVGATPRGDDRVGLWLTDDYLLLADEKKARAVRREEIVSLRIHRIGSSGRDYLAVAVRGDRLRFPIDRLEAWEDRAEGLRAELDRRQRDWRTQRDAPKPAGGLQSLVAQYAASRDFTGLLHWLDESMGSHTDETSRAAARDVMATALGGWPDETRRAHPGWYLLDGEFAGSLASWLLPLSRALVIDRADALLPDVAAVRAAADTFRDVPLTVLEIAGPLTDAAFEAVLAWAASKTLQRLSLPDATSGQQERWAVLRAARMIP